MNYKLIHTPKQTVWASKPHKFQDGYKLFIPTTDKYKVFIDSCGMTKSIVFIICEGYEHALQLKLILEHPLYVFIRNICRWGNFNNIRILIFFSYNVQFRTLKSRRPLFFDILAVYLKT